MDERKENLVLIDWLSFTLPINDPDFVIFLLGLGHVPWEEGDHGFYRYQKRLYFGSISILYDGSGENMGCCCEMSGQGCRMFESLTTLENDWEDLFRSLDEYHFKITRLDVAYDDHTGILDLDQLTAETRHRDKLTDEPLEYVSTSRSWSITESNKGTSIGFGSMKTGVYIRIYDKARERNCPRDEHWIRVELQMRDDNAMNFLKVRNDRPIKEVFLGVLLDKLRFVRKPKGSDDSNKWRWPLKKYWQKLVEDVETINIYSRPGLEYNIDRCHKYVINQAGNAIAALIEAYGPEKFEHFLKHRPSKPNKKYDVMVREYMEQRRKLEVSK